MPLIPNADTNVVTRDAVVLDLGDLARQAEVLKQRARDEAERIVAEANEERQRLLRNASEEGFAQGKQQGFESGQRAGYEEGRLEAFESHQELITNLKTSWTAALEEFTRQRDRMLAEARIDVLRLALDIARRVTRRVVECDPETVERQLAAALERVLEPSRLTVRAHPDDTEIIAAAMPSLTAEFARSPHVDIQPDAAVERGGCVVRTERGEVDAGIDTQLDRIVAALLPGAADATLSQPRPDGSA